MPNTVTTYHTFQAGTKARSSQVNTNFSNHRGTLIPIAADTAAAASLTYDLGSSEYYWLNAYIRTINFLGATSTGNLTIERDSSITAGSFPVKVGGTEIGRFASDGARFNFATFTVLGLTTTGNLTFAGDGATTAGSFPVKVGGNEVARFDPTGLTFNSEATRNVTTTVSATDTTGSVVITGAVALAHYTGSNNTILSCNFTSVRGNPVVVELISAAGSAGYIENSNSTLNIEFHADSTHIGGGGVNAGAGGARHTPANFRAITVLTAGSSKVISCRLSTSANTATVSAVGMVVWEM